MRCHTTFLRFSSSLLRTPAALLPLLLTTLYSCQAPPPPAVPLAAPPPVVVASPPVKKPAVPPAPVKAPAGDDSLLIVLSDSSAAYGQLVEKIRTHSAHDVIVLSLDAPLPGERSLASQLKSRQGPIIAIGIEAAKFLAPLARQRDIVFSLVFNHREHRLLEQGMIGVSMLPPPEQVLRLVKAISPQTTSLALPISPDLADYAILARNEAKKLGMSLDTPEVSNDKELLLLTRKLDPAIRGLWLLPDNRVISRDSLQQLMAVSVKSSRLTVVFSPTLFPLGGLLSAEYDADATATAILEVTASAPEQRHKLHGELLRPRTGHLTLNPAMVKNLGLTVPAKFQHLLQAGR